MGWSGKVGALEPGYYADIIAVDRKAHWLTSLYSNP